MYLSVLTYILIHFSCSLSFSSLHTCTFSATMFPVQHPHNVRICMHLRLNINLDCKIHYTIVFWIACIPTYAPAYNIYSRYIWIEHCYLNVYTHKFSMIANISFKCIYCSRSEWFTSMAIFPLFLNFNLIWLCAGMRRFLFLSVAL